MSTLTPYPSPVRPTPLRYGALCENAEREREKAIHYSSQVAVTSCGRSSPALPRRL